MAKKKIGDIIAEWMDAYGKENGYELSRTEFVKEAGTWYLRVYVDKLENGIYSVMGTEDCEKISRWLSEKLDEADPIQQNYFLEVSSPGMDRPLISDKDFERFMGELIEISLYKPLDGSKFLVGKLTGYDGINVTIIADDNKEITLPKDSAGKINLAVVF